jgi:hypothetical protein
MEWKLSQARKKESRQVMYIVRRHSGQHEFHYVSDLILVNVHNGMTCAALNQ